MGLFSTPQTQSVDPVELARQQVRAREQENLIGRASLNPTQTIGLLYGQAGRSLGRAIEKLSGYEDPLITQARKLQQTNKNTERAEEEAFKIAEKNKIPFGTSRFFDLVGESYVNYNLPLQGLLSYRLQNADSIQKADQRAQTAQLQTNDTATRQHLANETRNIPRYTGLSTNDDELDYYNEEIHKNEYLLKIISLAATNPKAPLGADYSNTLNDTINALRTSIADLKNKRVKRQTQVKTKSQEYEGLTDAFLNLTTPERLQNVTDDEKKIYKAAYDNFNAVRTQKNMDKVLSVIEKIRKEEKIPEWKQKIDRLVELSKIGQRNEAQEIEYKALTKSLSGSTINVYTKDPTTATGKTDIRGQKNILRTSRTLLLDSTKLLGKVAANPRAVGVFGFASGKLAGVASAFNAPGFADKIAELGTGLDAEGLKNIATAFRFITASVIPIATGEASGRVTESEQRIAKRIVGAEDIFQGADQVNATLKQLRILGLNNIFRAERDLKAKNDAALFKLSENKDPDKRQEEQNKFDEDLIIQLQKEYGMTEEEAYEYYVQFIRLRNLY